MAHDLTNSIANAPTKGGARRSGRRWNMGPRARAVDRKDLGGALPNRARQDCSAAARNNRTGCAATSALPKPDEARRRPARAEEIEHSES